MRYPQNTRIKVALVFVCSLILILGGILLLRGVFTKYPLKFNNSSVLGLSTNGEPVKATSLKPVTSEEGRNEISSNAFKSYFNTYKTGNLWLEVMDGDKKLIGYLDSFKKFNAVFTLDSEVLNLKILSESSILYIDNSEFSKIVVTEKTGNQTILNEDKSGKFVDVFFSESDRSFYYILSSQGIIYIYSGTLDSSQSVLFQTDLLSSKTKIFNVDNEFIYLKDVSKCYKISILDKNLIDYSCRFEKFNEEYISYKIEEKINDQTLLPIVQIIHSQPMVQVNDKKIFEDNDRILAPNAVNNSIIFALQSRIPKNYPTLIKKLNLQNLTVEVIAEDIPIGNLKELIYFSNEVYAISEIGGVYNLFKYTRKVTSYPQIDAWEMVFVGVEKPVGVRVFDSKYFVE